MSISRATYNHTRYDSPLTPCPFCLEIQMEEQKEALKAKEPVTLDTPKANDIQVGGSHYRDIAGKGEQHWDRMWRMYGEAWFVGNITKYVERYRDKDGVKDLKKAQHYLQKLIELEEALAASKAKLSQVGCSV